MGGREQKLFLRTAYNNLKAALANYVIGIGALLVIIHFLVYFLWQDWIRGQVVVYGVKGHAPKVRGYDFFVYKIHLMASNYGWNRYFVLIWTKKLKLKNTYILSNMYLNNFENQTFFGFQTLVWISDTSFVWKLCTLKLGCQPSRFLTFIVITVQWMSEYRTGLVFRQLA